MHTGTNIPKMINNALIFGPISSSIIAILEAEDTGCKKVATYKKLPPFNKRTSV
jgi:hypothetical protein